CALDLATGRGAILFPLAERVGERGRVLGVDLAVGMAVETAAEARRRGLRQVRVLAMDADALGWQNARFDLITCGFALFFVDIDAVLTRLYGLLRPGGTLAVSVNRSAG